MNIRTIAIGAAISDEAGTHVQVLEGCNASEGVARSITSEPVGG